MMHGKVRIGMTAAGLSALFIGAAAAGQGQATEGQAAQGQAAKANSQDKVEIEGVVSERTGTCPAITFSVAGVRIATGAETRFEDGTCADIAQGRKVEVDGVRQKDGGLKATEIELD